MSIIVEGTLLSIKILIVGFILLIWSIVPALIDITFFFELFFPNIKDPQQGQKNFVIVLPLSEICLKLESLPWISTLFSEKNKFVPNIDPVALRQSLQWQLNIAVGSA